MNNCLRIGPQPVDRKMHPDLAGNLPRPRKLPSLKIDDHHIFRPQQKLASSRRSRQNPVSIKPYREIPRGSRHEAKPMQHPSEPDQASPKVTFHLRFARQGTPLRTRYHTNLFDPEVLSRSLHITGRPKVQSDVHPIARRPPALSFVHHSSPASASEAHRRSRTHRHL